MPLPPSLPFHPFALPELPLLTRSTLAAENKASSPYRLAVKDNIATLPEDGPTGCASSILAGYESPFEASIVKQLKSFGYHVVGKTNMDEFGMGSHSTNSPHGPVAQELPDGTKLSAGGSSGGSAVAVATGAADLALGTDTGGSVRLPAAYCGVVGFKPSYGLISRHGVVPYANSLDTVGFLARDVSTIDDSLVRRKLLLDPDPLDPTSLQSTKRKQFLKKAGHWRRSPTSTKGDSLHRHALKARVFGIPTQYNIEELDPAIRQGWQDVATFLRYEIGAIVCPVSLPMTKHALSAYYVIAPAEASSNLAKYDGVRYGPKQPDFEDKHDDNGGVLYSTIRGQLFGEEVKRRILLGSYTLSSEAIDNYFLQAQRVRQLVRRDFDRVFRLENLLLDEDAHQFDMTDMDENTELESKLGPAQCDFLLCPTAPTLPPRLEDVQAGQQRNPVDAYMNDVFTVPASLAGLPAISIPKKVDGPPGRENVMGLQIIGQYGSDAGVLRVAAALESLLDPSE